jgi:phage baseplate assembly protein W
MADYGHDVSTYPVTDMTGRTISGSRVVAECLLRRYMTPNGSLAYDRDFGCDLRFLLNGDFTATELRQHEARAAYEATKDERIASASVSFTLDTAASKLRIRISGVLSNASSFDFVLAIDKVTSQVLAVN